MNPDRIEMGDIVRIDFNQAKFTLSKRAKVIYIPCATGDSWIFRDLKSDTLYYVTEGCTLTLMEQKND